MNKSNKHKAAQSEIFLVICKMFKYILWQTESQCEMWRIGKMYSTLFVFVWDPGR